MFVTVREEGEELPPLPTLREGDEKFEPFAQISFCLLNKTYVNLY